MYNVVFDANVLREDPHSDEDQLPSFNVTTTTTNSLNEMDGLNSVLDKVHIVNPIKSYYTMDEYNKIHINDLSIISLNINSFKKHIDDLNAFITSMQSPPDIIILTETRHHIEGMLNQYFQNYNYCIAYPETNHCGGVLVLIKDWIKYEEINNCKIINSSVENIVIELKSFEFPIWISALYKHPKLSIKEFSKVLCNQLESLPTKATLILLGDFNIDLKDIDNDVNKVNYVNKINSYNLQQIITAPTRITNHSNTIIDHIYVSGFKAVKLCRGILLNQISDHLCTFVRMNTKPKLSNKDKSKIRIMSKQNIEKFKAEISKIELPFQCNDPNKLWNIFIESVTNAFNNSFPTTHKSKQMTKNKAWLTSAIFKSIKTKEKLYKKWMNNRNPIHEQNYKNYKNKLSTVIKNAKIKYMSAIFTDDKNSKKLWNEINSILGKKKKTTNIDYLEHDNTKIKDKGEISNYLNKHFSTIGKKMSDKISYSMNDFTNFMPNRLNKSILLERTSENEIRKIINDFSNKNSSGLDQISQKLLINVSELLIPNITKLINLSIDKCIYPDCLKVAKIIPVYKNGKHDDCNNYRPISLLSSFNKIFEKKIQKDLLYFIETNNILHTNQFGFKKFHNTIDALIKTHDHIISERRKGNKIIGIFIDLKKAFDSIDNKILVKKLEYYGISGPFNYLIKSYLTNRYCMTQVDTKISMKDKVEFGVPQGSVLGPILFNLYINDLKNIGNDATINLFADDTCIFCSDKQYDELNQKCNNILNECNRWLKSNALTLNVQKTHFVDFSTKKNDQAQIRLNIGNDLINECTETKYLGMTLQNNLNWNTHIQTIIKKINSKIPLMYQLRDILPNDKRITIYNSLIMSHIIYGIELYAKNKSKWLDILQKAQNRILKILLKLNRRTSVSLMHKQNNILKIKDLYKLRSLLIGHKVIHFPNETNIAHVDIKRNERSMRNNLSLQISAESYSKNCKISERASTIWNEIPNGIKLSKNRDMFKSKIKELFLNEYR